MKKIVAVSFLVIVSIVLVGYNIEELKREKKQDIAFRVEVQDALNAPYLGPKKNILIVPGHDNIDVGAQYLEITEAVLTCELAKAIIEQFNHDARFTVYITRDCSTGEYTKAFKEYFEKESDAINAFIIEKRADTKRKLLTGNIVENIAVEHTKANTRTTKILYGINKWANEEKIDLILHLHYNSDPRYDNNEKGRHSGFSIYVPEKQLINSEKSYYIGKKIHSLFMSAFPTSSLKIERGGFIEAQSLIALGSNNSLTVPSVLIEYAYIYEPQARTKEDIIEKAIYTHLGIVKAFFE
ncbi:MAG: N-acetylmuramoyl-L-alanine amidase [Alphaproteobacteria bacterium]|nr:N-acetylmuramoyl-L-alanine amidase [Alphaproteobacteria bacterium]